MDFYGDGLFSFWRLDFDRSPQLVMKLRPNTLLCVLTRVSHLGISIATITAEEEGLLQETCFYS